MSENKVFDFSIEIDPDYVRQTANEPDPKSEPERIKTKKAWIMSLALPVLSIHASACFVILGLLGSSYFCVFTALFGLVGGGIVPTVMIVRGGLDTSKFFLGKMILIFASIATWFIFNYTKLEYWVFDILGGFAYQIFILTAELIFAAVQKTDLKTKICLALSSLAWGFLGFSLDFYFCFNIF